MLEQVHPWLWPVKELTPEKRSKSKNQEQQKETTMHWSQPPVPPIASLKGLRADSTDFEPGERGGKVFSPCLIFCFLCFSIPKSVIKSLCWLAINSIKLNVQRQDCFVCNRTGEIVFSCGSGREQRRWPHLHRSYTLSTGKEKILFLIPFGHLGLFVGQQWSEN